MLGVISTNGVLKELGALVGRGAVLSALLVLAVLPGILYSLDKIIEKTTRGAGFAAGGAHFAVNEGKECGNRTDQQEEEKQCV